jgi:hypothetical protein
MSTQRYKAALTDGKRAKPSRKGHHLTAINEASDRTVLGLLGELDREVLKVEGSVIRKPDAFLVVLTADRAIVFEEQPWRGFLMVALALQFHGLGCAAR